MLGLRGMICHPHRPQTTSGTSSGKREFRDVGPEAQSQKNRRSFGRPAPRACSYSFRVSASGKIRCTPLCLGASKPSQDWNNFGPPQGTDAPAAGIPPGLRRGRLVNCNSRPNIETTPSRIWLQTMGNSTLKLYHTTGPQHQD